MKNKILPALGALLAATLVCGGARAASCSFSTVVGVAFGAYNVFSPVPLDSTGSVTFVCTGVGSSDTIVVDLSAGNGASFSPRAMTQAGASLSYNLYLDAARTSVWGNGAGGTSHHGPVTPVSGSSVTVPIYGRVPARQNVSIGTYADTIVATILF